MNDEELAALAGFTVAFFKSDSELWSLFQKAKSQNYSGQRLLAEARNTNWFKKNSESARQAQLLKTSDPAEYKARLQLKRDEIWDMLRQMGGTTTAFGLSQNSKVVTDLAEQAFTLGWSKTTIQRQLRDVNLQNIRKIMDDPKATLRGRAAAAERMARQLSSEYGIKISDGTIANWAARFADGRIDENFMRNWFTTKAKNTFAGVAGDIDAGMTVRQIAEPYIDAMSRIWEIAPGEIDLRNSRIRRALTFRDDKGKAAAQPLWQYEESLKKDPRWNKTNNAREEMFGAGHTVLRDLGLVF